jgi:hypothetical protein
LVLQGVEYTLFLLIDRKLQGVHDYFRSSEALASNPSKLRAS